MDQSDMALLVMDVEPSIVAKVADKDEYVEQVYQAVEEAREKRIPIFFIVVGFRPGFPEIGDHNKIFGTTKKESSSALVEPSPVIAPNANELVITKRRVSAFTGSDLEVILRAQAITHLVLCGVSTGGVILSTTREAADKDYKLTILSDLCRDRDEEVHRVLLEKVLSRQADVTTSQEWLKTI